MGGPYLTWLCHPAHPLGPAVPRDAFPGDTVAASTTVSRVPFAGPFFGVKLCFVDPVCLLRYGRANRGYKCAECCHHQSSNSLTVLPSLQALNCIDRSPRCAE